MSDTPDNLVLAMLREIRADISGLRQILREHGHDLTTLKAGQLASRRDAVADATSALQTAEKVGEHEERLNRIERRLELRD